MVRMVLTKDFFKKDTVNLAKSLLGCILVNETPEGRTAGIIVEVESYLGKNDPASHAFRGLTESNRVMFGPPGRAYIYFIYGMYFCLNVSAAPDGVGEGVLLRALEPMDGIELMEKRTGSENVRRLCNGPGKLTRAMGIDKGLAGHDLITKPLYLLSADDPKYKRQNPEPKIVATTRVGLSRAKDSLLRFYIKDSLFVSRK